MQQANTISEPDSPESLYLQKIHTHPDLIELPFSDQYVPFEQLYVNQTVTEEKQEGGRSGESATASDQALHQMAMASIVKQVEVDLWQKLRQDHRVVVTAPAWTGKSTLCKWVVQHCHAKMHWLPIYVPFRSLSQSSHSTLLGYLEQDYLEWLGLEGVTIDGQQPDDRSSTVSLGRWLYDQWQAGQALLILDGADEEFDRSKREAVLSALPTTGTRMTRPRVLLTSRPGGEAGVLGFEKIELQEFTRKQIEALILNCGMLLDAQEKTQKLLRDMKEGHQPRAWQFAGRPGHLIQMVVTYIQEGVLLAWEEDQMDRIAIRRFQVTERVTPKLEPDDPRLKRQLTEELAFHSLLCRKGQAQTRAQMLDLLTHIIHAKQKQAVCGYRPQQVSRLLNDLCANSGFLKNTRQGLVEWESVPWLQFFAASYLAQQLEPDTGDPTFQHWAYAPPNEQTPITLPCAICHITLPQFAHYLWRPEWQEVLLLVAGVLKVPMDLLRRLEQEPDDMFHRITILRAHILGYARNTPRDIISQTSVALLRHQDTSVQLAACQAFGTMRNSAARDELERTLTNKGSWVLQGVIWILKKVGTLPNTFVPKHTLPKMDSSIRRAAAEALGKMGDPASRTALERVLVDKDTDVRRAAAEALEEIGVPAARAAREWLLAEDATLRENDYLLYAVGIARHALEKWLADENSWSRLPAARAVGTSGGPADLAALEQALVDEDSAVRRGAAAGALGEIGNLAALPALKRTLNDTDTSVRKAGRRGLRILCEKGSMRIFPDGREAPIP